MKLLALTITVISLLSCSFFQDDDIALKDVPASVVNTFQKTFPNARDIDWEKKKRDFEVDFEIDNVDFSARFDASGKMLMYKKDISISEIPEAVMAKIQKDFKDYRIDDVERVEKDNQVYYQVELDSKLIDRKEIFTENGEKASRQKYWD